MKKLLLLMVVLGTFFLSACSFLDGVNNSLDYVNETTEHINKLSDFAAEAPQLIQDAAQDEAARKELAVKLTDVKESVERFIAQENVPGVAKDIHAELVAQNEVLLKEINKVIDNGHVAIDKLENSEIFTTIESVQGLLGRIEKLGL